MKAQATWLQSEQRLTQEILESNLLQLGVLDQSKDSIQNAEPEGELISLPDGSLALLSEQSLFGANPSSGGTNRAVESISRSEKAAVVVFGLGLGHTVRELRARLRGPIVVFDPNPSLVRTVLESGPTDLGGVHLSCELDELRAHWATFTEGKNASNLVTTPGYRDTYAVELEQLRRALDTLHASATVSDNTLHIRAKSWVQNLMANLANMTGRRPFGFLRNEYRNVPAFIVGAGPSVRQNAHLLPEATRKGIVFAVNSSASILASNRAEPQVLVCLEAANHANQLRNLPWIDRVNRALSLSASPATWQLPGGTVMPFYENILFFKGLRNLFGVDGITVAGSVSTAAFSLAEQLGCSPIVFIGQDLAFTEGKVHASGTEIENSRVHVDRKSGRIRYEWCDSARRIFADVDGAPSGEVLSEVTAWGGHGKVVSSATWNLVRDWLKAKAESLNVDASKVRLINATEGGSRIPGFEEIRLKDLLATLPELNITSETMRKVLEKHPPVLQKNIERWVDDQLTQTKEAAKAAESLKQAAQGAMRAIGLDDPSRVLAEYKVVADAERALHQSVAQQPMLNGWCQAAIDDVIDVENTDNDCTAIDEARKGLETESHVADIVKSSAHELIEELSKAKQMPQTKP